MTPTKRGRGRPARRYRRVSVTNRAGARPARGPGGGAGGGPRGGAGAPGPSTSGGGCARPRRPPLCGGSRGRAGLVGGGEGAAPADELALGEGRGVRGPARDRGELGGEAGGGQDDNRRKRGLQGLEHRDRASREAARGRRGGALHEED